ncbi:MAG: YARHG domain-containing protein, partial [Ruminococcus sp.]|nr:YARHG domain-containing protein [Ruminococcus sp.]
KNEPEPAENADDTKVIDTETVNAAAAAAAGASAEEEYSGEEIDRMLDENEKNRRRQQDRLNAEKQKQLLEIEKRRQQKRKKQIRNRLFIALAILIVLGGVGSGVYYLQTQNGGVPEVEVVTEAPEFTPDVVSEVQTEEPGAEATEAPAEATQQAGWQSSGTASTASGGAAAVSGGTAAGGSSTNKSTSSGGSAKQSSGTAKSTAPAAGSSTKQSGTASTGSKNTVSTSPAQPKAGTNYSAKGGYDGEKFNAALITGKEVVNGGSKKYLAFDFNGTTYYANIDSGSSTADVAGKPMTINAYKTSEVYNGVSVYEITALTKYNSSYVFPESGYRLLTEADLKGKSARELYIGRNEIYARHGRQFKDKTLQTYFNSCSWYKIKASYNTANDAANLNSIEFENANFIKKYEDSHK